MRNSSIHGLLVTMHLLRVKSDKSDRLRVRVRLLCACFENWTFPVVATLGADQKERSLWEREWRIATYLASIFPYHKYVKSSHRTISSILAFCKCKLAMFSGESLGTRCINAFLNRYFRLFCCSIDKFMKFRQGKRTCIHKLKNKY